MSRTLHVDVELTVSDKADPLEVADWLFELLVETVEDTHWHPAVDSIDGTTPGRPS